MATGFGCWVKGKKIYSLSTTHIQFVISNVDKFNNITLDEIKKIYDKYGEALGSEMTAREEIIKKVAQSGNWIRVREYLGKTAGTYWSIQGKDFQLQSQRESILYFLDYALKHKIMNPYDEIRMLSYNTGEMLLFPFKEGGVSKLLEEYGGNSN